MISYAREFVERFFVSNVTFGVLDKWIKILIENHVVWKSNLQQANMYRTIQKLEVSNYRQKEQI